MDVRKAVEESEGEVRYEGLEERKKASARRRTELCRRGVCRGRLTSRRACRIGEVRVRRKVRAIVWS